MKPQHSPHLMSLAWPCMASKLGVDHYLNHGVTVNRRYPHAHARLRLLTFITIMSWHPHSSQFIQIPVHDHSIDTFKRSISPRTIIPQRFQMSCPGMHHAMHVDLHVQPICPNRVGRPSSRKEKKKNHIVLSHATSSRNPS